MLDARRSWWDIRGADGTVSGVLYDVTFDVSGDAPKYVFRGGNQGNNVDVTWHNPFRRPMEPSEHEQQEARMLDSCFWIDRQLTLSRALPHVVVGNGGDNRQEAWSLQPVVIDTENRLFAWIRAPNTSFAFSDFYGPDTGLGCCYYIIIEAIPVQARFYYVAVMDGNTTPGLGRAAPWITEHMHFDEWANRRFRLRSGIDIRTASELPLQDFRSWVQREQWMADPTRGTNRMRYSVATPMQTADAVVSTVSDLNIRTTFAPVTVRFPLTKDLYVGQKRYRYTNSVYKAIVETSGHTNHVRFNQSRGAFDEYAITDMRLHYVVFMALIRWMKPQNHRKAVIVSAEDVIDRHPLYIFQHRPLPDPTTFFRIDVSLMHLRIHIPLAAPDVSLLLSCAGRDLLTLYLTVSGHPVLPLPYFWNLERIVCWFQCLKQFRLDFVGDFLTAIDWLFQSHNPNDVIRRYQSALRIVLPRSFQTMEFSSGAFAWTRCQVWIERFTGSLCPDDINLLQQRRAFGQQFHLQCNGLPPADMHPGDGIIWTMTRHPVPTHRRRRRQDGNSEIGVVVGVSHRASECGLCI